MEAMLWIIGAIALPFYIHACMSVAARAWFNQKSRHHYAMLQSLEKENG